MGDYIPLAAPKNLWSRNGLECRLMGIRPLACSARNANMFANVQEYYYATSLRDALKKLGKNGQQIPSKEPVETEAIMESLKVTADNAAIISDQLAEIMIKVNGGKGTIGRLIQDSTIAENLSQTMVNIRKSSRGLNEDLNAAKHNFLLKGYFNKKAKAEQAKKDSLDKVKAKEQKRIERENKK